MTDDPAPPKRNSGRTGHRRLTAAEAAMRGDARHHRLRYGTAPTAAALTTGLLPAAAPPAWLDSEEAEAWARIIADAPSGLLKATDSDLVAALAEAVVRHRRAVLAHRKLAKRTSDEAVMAPRRNAIRAALRDMLAVASTLCLPPGYRSRLTLPAVADPLAPFVVIEGGREAG
jgi:phage terminase small subunit